MKEMLFGFNPTEFDGTERTFNADETIELPEKYTYRPYLPHVLDQGEESICVPCTVSAYLNWRENLKDGETYYIPDDKRVVLYCKDRHPKDILRSYAHEMIHHMQNLEGKNLNYSAKDNVKDNVKEEDK